ncbi:MAG: hypothetical protein R3185_05510 [Candidatus Thermoplasmatota archaeon]|nr:hypothetical protein [Candidatus Thermoplasmatota archaeon]
MAHYLVRAYPDHTKLPALKDLIQDGEVAKLEPYGQELDQALRRARLDPNTGQAVWEEEDHCIPPLKAEREEVLDTFFEDYELEEVDPGAGWAEIEALPSLWWDPIEAAETNVKPDMAED